MLCDSPLARRSARGTPSEKGAGDAQRRQGDAGALEGVGYLRGGPLGRAGIISAREVDATTPGAARAEANRPVRLVLACLLLALAACGKDYKTPQELVGALREKGLNCSGLQVKSGRQALRSFGEDGSCVMDGEQVVIWTFNDSEERDQWFEFAGRAFEIPYAMGSTWVVASRSGTTVERVQKAIGGEVKRPGEGR